MFINWNLVKHPTNWLTILLMLVLLGIAGHLVLSLFGLEPATAETPGSIQRAPSGADSSL